MARSKPVAHRLPRARSSQLPARPHQASAADRGARAPPPELFHAVSPPTPTCPAGSFVDALSTRLLAGRAHHVTRPSTDAGGASVAVPSRANHSPSGERKKSRKARKRHKGGASGSRRDEGSSAGQLSPRASPAPRQRYGAYVEEDVLAESSPKHEEASRPSSAANPIRKRPRRVTYLTDDDEEMQALSQSPPVRRDPAQRQLVRQLEAALGKRSLSASAVRSEEEVAVANFASKNPRRFNASPNTRPLSPIKTRRHSSGDGRASDPPLEQAGNRVGRGLLQGQLKDAMPSPPDKQRPKQGDFDGQTGNMDRERKAPPVESKPSLDYPRGGRSRDGNGLIVGLNATIAKKQKRRRRSVEWRAGSASAKNAAGWEKEMLDAKIGTKSNISSDVDSDIERTACLVCRDPGDYEHMVLCDACSNGCHTYCMRPARDTVPLGIWMCPDCHLTAQQNDIHISKMVSLMSEHQCFECTVRNICNLSICDIVCSRCRLCFHSKCLKRYRNAISADLKRADWVCSTCNKIPPQFIMKKKEKRPRLRKSAQERKRRKKTDPRRAEKGSSTPRKRSPEGIHSSSSSEELQLPPKQCIKHSSKVRSRSKNQGKASEERLSPTKAHDEVEILDGSNLPGPLDAPSAIIDLIDKKVNRAREQRAEQCHAESKAPSSANGQPFTSRRSPVPKETRQECLTGLRRDVDVSRQPSSGAKALSRERSQSPHVYAKQRSPDAPLYKNSEKLGKAGTTLVTDVDGDIVLDSGPPEIESTDREHGTEPNRQSSPIEVLSGSTVDDPLGIIEDGPSIAQEPAPQLSGGRLHRNVAVADADPSDEDFVIADDVRDDRVENKSALGVSECRGEGSGNRNAPNSRLTSMDTKSLVQNAHDDAHDGSRGPPGGAPTRTSALPVTNTPSGERVFDGVSAASKGQLELMRQEGGPNGLLNPLVSKPLKGAQSTHGKGARGGTSAPSTSIALPILSADGKIIEGENVSPSIARSRSGSSDPRSSVHAPGNRDQQKAIPASQVAGGGRYGNSKRTKFATRLEDVELVSTVIIRTWVVLNVAMGRSFNERLFMELRKKTFFDDAMRILYSPVEGIRAVAFSRIRCYCEDNEKWRRWWVENCVHFAKAPEIFPDEKLLDDVRRF